MLRCRTCALLIVACTAGPAFSQAHAGTDQEVCGDSTTLQAWPLGVDEYATWSIVSGAGVFYDPGDPLSSVTGLAVGPNVFEWILTDYMGIITSDFVTITAYDPDATASASAGPDATWYFPPAAAILSATECAAPCYCEWDDSYYTFVDVGDPNTIVSNLMVADNLITWNCYNGPCGGGPFSDVVNIYLDAGSLTVFSVPTSVGVLYYDAAHDRLRMLGRVPATALRLIDASGRMVIAFPAGPQHDWSVAGVKTGLYVAQAEVNGAPRSWRVLIHR
ncbi:MAG: hypothetical protein WAU70_16635 [Flavobacteriales bacterium]